MHPTKPEMLTVGRDAMLAIWDMPTRKQKVNYKLEGPADAVAISNSGQHIAVGFMNGKLRVFTVGANGLNSIKERASDRKGKAIQVMRYSPNDQILAVGGHDSNIIVYNAAANYKPLKRIKSHHSTVTHLDFSMDSSALMSNCTSYEILFHDMGSFT